MVWLLGLLFLLLASSSNACDRCIHQSTAAYYSANSPTSNGWGACRTGFVLSKKGFSAMARKGNIQKLLNLTSIDVEYKRSHYKSIFVGFNLNLQDTM
ncbi:hypothetical protein SDJN02_26705, partial [Cucurbita argyrosperma subsp. argyrosperma]